MAVTLSPVEAADLRGALAAALDGGPPVAPLPSDPVERAGVSAMLRAELPVTEVDAGAIAVTSGSTGRPKGVVLSRAAIRASVAATHARLGGPGNWLLALPGHYVAGLMVHARAIAAGTDVRAIRSDLTDLPQVELSASRPSYLSIVVTQLSRALEDQVLTRALSRLHAVLLGGGPVPAALLSRARAAGIRVVTTYGMSETCGGCVYDGRPLDGVSVEIDQHEAITLSGPMVFSGYRLRPDLTARALSGTGFHTRDRGRWCDGRLELLGRLDDVVISGGLNVDLAAVEQAARGWADLRSAEVVVLGVPDWEWGTVVVAVTDAAQGVPGSELDDLRAHLARSLPAHALPKRLLHRNPLPRTPGGKIDRHRLRREFSAVGCQAEGRR